MKKVISISISILVFVALLFGLNLWLTANENARSGFKGGGNVLNIYNWGDYIDPALISKFTKETGIKVNYETFDSNEAMYTKVKQGGNSYDLVVPSEYMIEKMKSENLLLPIDKKEIPNLKNYGSQFLNQSFDRGNKYTVPYFWGTLGIVYNDKYVKANEIKHWNDLWNKRYRKSILLVDSSRDDLGFSLVSMGQSVNSKSVGTVEAAKAKLDTMMPNVKAILNDEIKMYMVQDEA
ncbi:MAG: extracellular solute-binding protein, partial [Lactobacillaceae bacterium]|nr:extracellular solute-binding protein [Lactobacillaceae bacterium]